MIPNRQIWLKFSPQSKNYKDILESAILSWTKQPYTKFMLALHLIRPILSSILTISFSIFHLMLMMSTPIQAYGLSFCLIMSCN